MDKVRICFPVKPIGRMMYLKEQFADCLIKRITEFILSFVTIRIKHENHILNFLPLFKE